MSLLRLLDESHRHAPLPFPLVPDEDWPLRVSFLENTMVRPEARGRGYHRALIDARAAYARAAGIRWICAGVHLRNRSSWANLLASGMVIVGIRFDPGYPIIGLLKSTDVSALDVDADDQVRVDGGDEAGHGSILEDGYVGVRLAADGGVVYHRLMRN
jgi:GNAT superfamily N-acetyltransferase